MRRGVSPRSEGDLYGLKPVPNITESRAVEWGGDGEMMWPVWCSGVPHLFQGCLVGILLRVTLVPGKELNRLFLSGPGAFAARR